MSEPVTPVFGIKAATILGVVFLIIYALFAALGAADRSQRSRLESMEALPLDAPHTHKIK